MGRGLAACAVVLTLAAVGCGDDNSGAEHQVSPARFADLLARLPRGEDKAIALDVAGARRELGLPPNAAPPAPPDHGTDGGRRLRGMTAATLLNYPIKDNGPLDRALDYSQVTGIARVDGPPEVLLVATRRPWDELKARLNRAGWHPRGDGVLQRPPGRALRWVAGRDGFVVAAGDPGVPRAVLDGRTRTAAPLLKLLTAAAGPARAARVRTGDSCVTGFAAGYSPAAAGGAFIVATRDVPPRPFRARRVQPLPQGYAAQTPQAAGGRVRIPFTFEASTDPAVQPASLALAAAPYFTYRC